MNAIRVEHVSKAYATQAERELKLWRALARPFGERRPRLLALQDVSFSVAQGEALGVVGPNGAGKTTLMRLLLGVTQPTSGRVALRGRAIGLLDLQGGLHRDLTGLENVLFVGAFAGLSRAEVRKRLDAILDMAECDKFPGMLSTQARYFSTGMGTRLAFAVLVHADPDILVVDEVLAVGDMAFRARCLERISALRRAGTSIVLVSHDLGQVTSFCDRALWLAAGQAQADGPVREVVAAYTAASAPRLSRTP